VGAFEDTKCSRSIVSDTLLCLTEQAKGWREKIDLLEAGQWLDREEAIASLGQLLDICQNLRDAILSEDSGATWKTKAELDSLVDRLDDVAARRTRYLDLAQLLVAGTVSHRRERTKQERLRQRDAAVAELMETSALPSPPDLPGPAIPEWLNWACSLDDSTNDPDLAKLKVSLPRVDDFVRQLEIEMWQDGKVSVSGRMVDSVPEIATKPNLSGEIPLIPEASRDQESTGSHLQTLTSESETETTGSIATETAPAAIEQATSDEMSKGEKASASQTESFFAAEEIESFSRYMEEALTEPKMTRSVRSLLAISQWLLPADQNPVLHPKYGIRGEIGYTGSSDLLPVSPEHAAHAIEEENALLLFVGGADLLRWSISQRADGHFDGIATLRRFSKDQIRSWFGQVYKIELADPQVEDMYRLTSGIPLLLGELHRLVIPNPKAPPTWLGFGIWTNIKASFERKLPVLARELRNGSPAVRLTESEIRLLKMVVIASNDSTPKTIASNLKQNWDKYHRPEIQAMNAKDEPSLRLLQSLGLLPVPGNLGLGPMQALLPVEANDALRQVVNYL
jgi:hypothetical protein